MISVNRHINATVFCAAVCGIAISAFAAPTSFEQEFERLQAEQLVFRAATERVAPFVVSIETVGGTQPPARARRPSTQPSDPPRRPAPKPTGSGFIIAEGPTTGVIYSADGLILTSAFNFILEPSLITVRLADGRRFVGELLAKDEARKLAMVKIDASDLQTPTWVEADSSIRVGQRVIALGRGLGGDECSISMAVQTDAKLSPVNYGGPLIDIDGRIVGINVPMGMMHGDMAGVELYDSGTGFAIPFSQVATSAKDLSVGHNLRRGMIGIAVDRRVQDKVIVTGIADPSPALNSGLQVGDQITAIDGTPIEIYLDLRRALASRLAGEWIKVTVDRAGRTIVTELILAVPEDLGDIPRPEPPAVDGEDDASDEDEESETPEPNAE
mgnify:CR=1 FL=1